MVYVRGDFSFIKDQLIRETLSHDFKAIDNIEGAWSLFKLHDPGKSFMYHTGGQLWSFIKEKMSNNHSHATMGYSMRIMETIAKYGWGEYVKSQLEKQMNEQFLVVL